MLTWHESPRLDCHQMGDSPCVQTGLGFGTSRDLRTVDTMAVIIRESLSIFRVLASHVSGFETLFLKLESDGVVANVSASLLYNKFSA